MRGWLLTAGSVLLTGLVIGNAYYQKQQFYPSVVYITKSNPSLAVLYLQAFVFVILVGQLSRKVFFGQLRPAETEHLIERSWYAVTETCLAFTVFRDNFSSIFVAQFTLLLFLKCFHWLSEDRVEYMERSPVISYLFHIRAISLLTLLGTLDSMFIHKAYFSVLSSGASTQLVFGFEYAILLTIVVAILMKYVLHTIDLQSDNPWENKAVYILYSELVMGFIKSSLYIIFMVIMIRVHTFPLFAIRPMYLTLRSFKKSINDVIMSRRAILNMNTLYPDATAEELAGGDNVCIICREEMFTTCKKLPCNHIFHTSCLRSWFQRQQTCPTCRMDVLQAPPPEPRPAQAIPPAQGIPPFGPAQVPPHFPMFPMGLPPVFQPGVHGVPVPMAHAAPPPGTTQPSAPTEAPGSSNLTINPATMPPFMPPFPMMFPPPPMFGFPYPTPPGSQSSPNLATLSPEELQAMEGHERENVEARITVLRNIHSLLDTAILQLNQYSQIIAAQTPSFSGGTVPHASAATGSESNASTSHHDVNVTSENIVGFESAAGPSWAAGDSNKAGGEFVSPPGKDNDDEPDSSSQVMVIDSTTNEEDDGVQSDIRRRRIQRFSSEPNDIEGQQE